jgi:uncharacterized protein YprB with RNaseH-like and TPR domain
LDLPELTNKLKELSIELGKTPTLREFVASGISKRAILKFGYNDIVRATGLETNKSAHDTIPIEVIYKAPNILFLDIETAPINAHVWGLRDQNIGLNQINEDWFIMAYCGINSDEPDKTYYLDQRYANPMKDDRQLLEGVHDLILKADIVCGHNVKKFDLKKINTRFIKHGLDPLNHYSIIDTLAIARRIFAFTSNKLEYIANFLECENRKSGHGKFPGMNLWTECLNKNMEAWNEMEDYNKLDVKTLIDVYNKLIPYDNSINFQAFYGETVCVCGVKRFYKDGLRYTKQGRFQGYRCSNCGKTFVGKENLLVKEMRAGFFK